MIAFLTDGWSAQGISALNGALAWMAFLTHVFAASRTSGHLGHMFMTIACLALFYAFAYWWLFFNPERVVEWSNFLRPFGVISWIAAWTIEPIVFILYLQKSGRHLTEVAETTAQVTQEFLDSDERFPT